MKKNIVGYALSGHDNGEFMFDEDDAKIARCVVCGFRLDFNATNPGFKLKRRSVKTALPGTAVTKRSAISATYDNQLIVSGEFRDFCIDEGYAGVEFGFFSGDPWHFHIKPTLEVIVDTVRGNTEFGKKCSMCKNYEFTVRGFDYLKVRDPLPDGLYRTDLLFGSGDRKSHTLIAGLETIAKLKSAGFRGLSIISAYGLD